MRISKLNHSYTDMDKLTGHLRHIGDMIISGKYFILLLEPCDVTYTTRRVDIIHKALHSKTGPNVISILTLSFILNIYLCE